MPTPYGDLGYGAGPFGGTDVAEGPLVLFTPPSHEEPIRTSIHPLYYYRQTWANSIVRIGGVLTSVRSPTHEILVAAGEEGVDWFMGGHIYEITQDQLDELTDDGFAENLDPNYGDGLYGEGPYGD